MRWLQSSLSCLPRGHNITPFVDGSSHAPILAYGSSPIPRDLVEGHLSFRVCLPPRWLLLLLLLWWWCGGDVPGEHIVPKGGLLVEFGGVILRVVLCNQLSGVVIGWTDVSSRTGHCWDHVWARAVLIDWCLCCCVWWSFLFTLDAMFDVMILYYWVACIPIVGPL